MSNESYEVNELMILETGDYDEKSEFLEELSSTEDCSLISPLLDALEREKNRAIRERILIVLNKIIPLSNFSEVGRMLRSPDPYIRNGVVEIIKRADIPLINFLRDLSEDDDKDVRKFVIDSLSTDNNEESIEIIRRRLDDTDINIVYTAVEYLGNFKDRASVDRIESFLLVPQNLMLICTCLIALAKINYSPRSKEIIAKYIDIDNPMVMFPLLKYLSTFGDEESLKFIEVLLRRKSDIFFKEIIDAVEGIIKNNKLKELPESLNDLFTGLMADTDNNVYKYEIIKLLTKTGSMHSLDKVRDMLTNSDDMTRISAVEILGDIGDETDIELLEELAGDTESDELLEVIGDAVMKIDERLSN